MSDLSDLWSSLVADALRLDVDALRSTLNATIDDGLRAASYDGPTARSASPDSHPERLALSDRRDSTAVDLALLEHHTKRFVEAVYELATRSHSGPFPTDWRTARLGAKRLDEMGAIEILVSTQQRPDKFVRRAGDALHDLELLAGRHLARSPNDHERSWTSGLADEDCCRLCLKHLNIRTEAYRTGLCQPHYNLRLDSRRHTPDGEPVDPPDWLSDELRRTGGPGPDWKRARSRWLLDLGPERRTA